MRKSLCLGIIFLMFAEIMSVSVLAGQWRQDECGWWWENDDGSYPAGSWEWLDGNGDRVYECYYFNEDGYMMTDTDVSDGSCLNEDGARELDGKVMTRRIAEDIIDCSEVAGHIVMLVNQERRKYNLPELTINEELEGNSRIRVKELQRSFSHMRPDGKSFHTALTIDYIKVGENIIYTQVQERTTEEELAGKFVDCWLNSDAHRKNILTSDWQDTGISVYINNNTIYAVQLFSNPQTASEL